MSRLAAWRPLSLIAVTVAACLVTTSCQSSTSGPGNCSISAQVMTDVSVPAGTEIAPGAAFTKTWRIKNDGSCAWESGTQLAYVSGETLGGPPTVSIPSLGAGSVTDVSVDFVAPVQPGTYRSTWRLQGPGGAQFGPELGVEIVVTGSAPITPTPAPGVTPTPTPTPTAGPTPTPTPKATPFGGGKGLIAFASNRAGSWDIYLMSSSEANLRRLTDSPSDESDPSLSLDGKKIAYDRFTTNEDIFVMNADGTGQTNLTDDWDGYDAEPSWSQDGGWIVFASDRAGGGTQIWIMRFDGSATDQVTSLDSDNHSPAWSPDGGRIAFEACRNGVCEIYTMTPHGTNLTRLTFAGVSSHGPKWSRDGSKIVYWRSDGIFVMNRDGSGQKQLTTGPGETYPAWSPDSSLIVFGARPGGNRDLWVMKPDGTGRQRLTSDAADDAFPSWS